MKASKIIIRIPEPCVENWQKMSMVEKGRHCGVCEKDVVDFSSMSNAQVVDFYNQSNGKICGRFNDSQLNIPMSASATEMKFSLPVIIATSALMSLTGCSDLPNLHTQGEMIAISKVDYSLIETPISPVDISPLMGEIAFVSEYIEVRGVVTEANGNEPIKGAIVEIERSQKTAITDKKGRYFVKIPYSCSKNDTLILKISYGLLGTKEVVLNHLQPKMKQDVVLEQPNLIMGMMRVEPKFSVKDCFKK
jgi:hypothetical protein